MEFYQTPYIFGVITIFETLLGYFFCRITQKEVNFIKDVLPNVASSALNIMGNPVNTCSQENEIKKRFDWLLRWNGVPSIVILHLANLFLIYVPAYHIVHLPQFKPPQKQESVQNVLQFVLAGYISVLAPFLLLRMIYYRFGRRWRLLEITEDD